MAAKHNLVPVCRDVLNESSQAHTEPGAPSAAVAAGRGPATWLAAAAVWATAFADGSPQLQPEAEAVEGGKPRDAPGNLQGSLAVHCSEIALEDPLAVDGQCAGGGSALAALKVGGTGLLRHTAEKKMILSDSAAPDAARAGGEIGLDGAWKIGALSLHMAWEL